MPLSQKYTSVVQRVNFRSKNSRYIFVPFLAKKHILQFDKKVDMSPIFNLTNCTERKQMAIYRTRQFISNHFSCLCLRYCLLKNVILMKRKCKLLSCQEMT